MKSLHEDERTNGKMWPGENESDQQLFTCIWKRHSFKSLTRWIKSYHSTCNLEAFTFAGTLTFTRLHNVVTERVFYKGLQNGWFWRLEITPSYFGSYFTLISFFFSRLTVAFKIVCSLVMNKKQIYDRKKKPILN